MNSSSKRTHPKPRFWRRCRLYFRRFRMAVWLLVLLGLGGLIYLNQVGLPSFIKKPILEKLRSRGLDLQFSRLRWRWIEGIVAEQVRFGGFDSESGPRLNAREVQVQLDRAALARFQFQVTGLRLRDGRLVWPVPDTNAPPRQLVVEKLRTDLRLLPDDQWQLEAFTAAFAGTTIQLSGMITNASAIPEWPIFRTSESTAAGQGPRRLRRLADLLETVQFDGSPELKLDVRGDARDLRSFLVRLSLRAEGAQTRWGALRQSRLTSVLLPASNQVSEAEVRLEAAAAETRWGAATNLHLHLGLKAAESETNLVRGTLSLTAADGWTPWAAGAKPCLSANWVHALTNPVPLSGAASLQVEQLSSRWASAGAFSIVADFRRDLEAGRTAPDPAWAWWTNLQPYQLSWHGHAENLQAQDLAANRLDLAGHWQAPSLVVSNVSLQAYDAGLQATGRLDVASRDLDLRVTTDLDPTRVAPLLPPGAARWLSQFTWRRAPRAEAQIALVLPPWTEGQPDWAAEVQPTLRLNGRFALDQEASYRGLSVLAAQSHFSYSNLCWHLPDLRITRPEGVLEAEHRANDRTKDFYWRIRSQFDPLALDPLLNDDQRRALALVELSQPPGITAEIWGRAHQPERTGFRGRVLLTNFSFRGESASRLETVVQYTNQVLEFIQPVVERGTQTARADGLRADFNLQRVFLTNGFSTFEPMVIARAIGRHVARAIEPYQFRAPPTARVHGVIPMHGEEGADLRFQIAGEDFHWWRFNVARIEGSVHWTNHQVHLADVQTHFYDGAAAGFANFDFRPGEPTRFEFVVAVTNALLERLMADLSSATNHLEGRLSGALTVTDGHSESWRSVNGYGHVALTNGLIWDIPIFGILTPVLNSISPGLGHSRASEGTCTFVITNGVIRTDNLEIRSPALRLQYRGTVDLAQQVEARVEAEPLRDLWVVGPLVSTVFWPVTKLFEYRVHGTLGEPRSEPVYLLPKLMLLPLRPLRTIKGWFQDNPRTPANGGPPNP